MYKSYLLFFSLSLPFAVNATDWLQFRHGPNRGACFPEKFPVRVSQQWVREFATPDPVFPGEVRLRYDATYEPVAMGETIFVPLMMTDSVTALDTANGKEVWQAIGGITPARYSEPHDLLLTSVAIYKGKDGAIHRKFSVKDPKKQSWNYQSGGYIAGDNLLVGGSDNFVTYDLASGDKRADQLKWFRRGCTPLRTSPHIATTRYRGNTAYIDLETQKYQPLWNLRGACSNNIFPANGILNVPNLSGGCTCNYTPTSMALVPRSVLKTEK